MAERANVTAEQVQEELTELEASYPKAIRQLEENHKFDKEAVRKSVQERRRKLKRLLEVLRSE